MNKKELIEHIGNTLDKYLNNTTFVKPVLTITEIAESNEVSLEFEVNKNCILLDDNRQELNKPVVPQFVAGWMNYCKLTGVDLYHAFEMSDLYLGNYAYQKDYPKLKGYFESENNQETFARAWLDGYTVEEKRYLVKMKGIKESDAYLNCDHQDKKWYFDNRINGNTVETYHTRKGLEDAGFDWVFDCPGIEIKEVE